MVGANAWLGNWLVAGAPDGVTASYEYLGCTSKQTGRRRLQWAVNGVSGATRARGGEGAQSCLLPPPCGGHGAVTTCVACLATPPRAPHPHARQCRLLGLLSADATSCSIWWPRMRTCVPCMRVRACPALRPLPAPARAQVTLGSVQHYNLTFYGAPKAVNDHVKNVTAMMKAASSFNSYGAAFPGLKSAQWMLLQNIQGIFGQCNGICLTHLVPEKYSRAAPGWYRCVCPPGYTPSADLSSCAAPAGANTQRHSTPYIRAHARLVRKSCSARLPLCSLQRLRCQLHSATLHAVSPQTAVTPSPTHGVAPSPAQQFALLELVALPAESAAQENIPLAGQMPRARRARLATRTTSRRRPPSTPVLVRDFWGKLGPQASWRKSLFASLHVAAAAPHASHLFCSGPQSLSLNERGRRVAGGLSVICVLGALCCSSCTLPPHRRPRPSHSLLAFCLRNSPAPVCAPGYGTSDGKTCQICAAGFFSAGSSVGVDTANAQRLPCTACPPNATAVRSPGAQSLSECNRIGCSVGQGIVISGACVDCLAGQVSAGGVGAACAACPAGQKPDNFHAKCIPGERALL